ncbi:hypothetical protein HPP92_015999 [Vanilla planifolia]|uniref:PDZ domain-containing protein n=1 Tax=Vanilla planifolia TaxID=51239 RepID=A0A835UU73_VANPL|nr:hypothetical protein HPP92_015999 [Vanilla planifolia]
MAAVLSPLPCSSRALSLGSSLPRATPSFCISHGHSRRSGRQAVRRRSSAREIEEKKRFLGRGKGERSCHPHGGGRGESGRSRSSALRSPGSNKKDRDLVSDLKEQQVNDVVDLRDSTFLDAVVKVYCTHIAADYSLPWQKQRHYTSTGSAFMIGNKTLLTNAHCVEHDTQVKVKKRGDDTKYVAKVLTTGVECDIALLSVDSEEFWKGAKPLRFGPLPFLQDAVTVVGYPLGGDTISVTKGVVSRIEVTPYAHGAYDLLGIQIDAALNPGNSGGPAFNDKGECIGVAFQVYRSEEVENIGYVIPSSVVMHFVHDYRRNGKYTGFPSLGVLLQKLENPALRTCLKLPSHEGVLVRRVEPTSPAHGILKEGDVIVSFDGVKVGCEGTVRFRSSERIAFRCLISKKFSGDSAELGIIRDGSYMKVQTILQPRVHLVLANEVNDGYEDLENQQILKFNGTRIKNIGHLAHLIDTCKEKYLLFEFEENFLAVLDRERAFAASPSILRNYGIPSERSADLREPYVDIEDNQLPSEEIGGSPVSNLELEFEGLIWA